MSEKTNEISLLREMIECLTREPCCISEHYKLLEVLQEEVIGKKFLLVLDGAEIENQGFWTSVLALLQIGAKGSFLLVATSSQKVASSIGTESFFCLDPLSLKNSWLIFLQFVVRPITGFDLRQACKQLVARCGGIPFCIKMLSRVLGFSDNNEAWFEVVLHNKLWEIDELGGNILPALRVCYDFLPIYLKHCLKYCSLFPKNFIFEKNHIILLWISQGFIDPIVGIEVEEIGTQWFDQLVDRSFLENCLFYNTKEDKFVMHELIYFLVQHVSKEEYFRSDDSMNSASGTIKHFSLAHGEFKADDINVVTNECSELSTFYVVNTTTSQCYSTYFPINRILPLDDLLMKFNNLRTLNLSGTDVEELPTSTLTLKNLCYLGLSASKIKALPGEIYKLINLQILEAKHCSHLVELPKGITELSKLRHLDMRKESGFVGIPSGIGRLTSLQTLPIVNVGDDDSQCSIGELKNLKNLRGSLQIAGLANVRFGNDAKEANLIAKKFLRSVTLHWNQAKGHSKCDEGLAFEVFEGLIPQDNLEELTIRN